MGLANPRPSILSKRNCPFHKLMGLLAIVKGIWAEIISIKSGPYIQQMSDMTEKLMREMGRQSWMFYYITDDGSQHAVVEVREEAAANQEFQRFQSEAEEMMQEDREQLLGKEHAKDCEREQNGRIEAPSGEQNPSVQTASKLQSGERVEQHMVDNEQSQYIVSRQRNPPKRKPKKAPYPTKNFLQTFRPFIIKYIVTHYPKARNHPKIVEIQGKSAINCKDFEELLNESQFRDVLEKYFREKKIYRDLLQSRVKYGLKRAYFNRIGVFEKAFRSGRFEKIN